MNVRATYRLQFHKDFTFADAEEVVPYLAELGISHLYASPITVAQPGSTHGYDVVDPTGINPELGGEKAFRSLAGAARARGLGIIIDIVPNHMGVAGRHNRWWQDLLEQGCDSRYAHFFDVDWREKLLLPFLGDPLPTVLAGEGLELREDEWGIAVYAYDTHRFPIRPEDAAEARSNGLHTYDSKGLTALLERQHYRLDWWRRANDELNWRRFFTITELASLRPEDPDVFETSHALYFRLYREGLIDGLRVDHVDGLTDPAGYCRSLRARLDALREERPPDLRSPAYVVVEKILAEDEPLPPGWAVDGTSGYDFMAEAAALLHEPEGEAPLTRYWAAISGRPPGFAAEEFTARRDMLAWEFEGQLRSCVDAFLALAGSASETQSLTGGMIRRATERLLWVFPVYRTYGTGRDAPPTDAAIRETARARALPLAAPGEGGVIERLLAWLAGDGPGDAQLAFEAVRRFQQLSAPIAAKAVEDTAFYRYGRLLSRNDVGFDPGRFSLSVADFHARMERRRNALPLSMLATATHDHKRGEDVRARLAVLSEVPEEWIEAVDRWNAMNQPEGLDPGDVYQLYQMLVGAWQEGEQSDWGERIAGWQEKALREAKLRSSWAAPNAGYEDRARNFLNRILASRSFGEDLANFVQRIQPAGQANMLVQVLLRCTVPGVPDLYQGTEFQDFSLVDPDNRRPVDFAARQAALESRPSGPDGVKQALVARLLGLRRERPALFAHGRYEPVAVDGGRADHVLAFLRRDRDDCLLVAAALRTARGAIAAGRPAPDPDWWLDTRLILPGGGRAVSELFHTQPVHADWL